MNKLLFTIFFLIAYTGIFAQRTTLPNTATQSPSNKNLNNLNGQLIQGRLVVNDSAWLNGAQSIFPSGNVGIGTVFTPRFKLHVATNDANGFYAKARVIPGKRAWISISDSINPFAGFNIYGSGMFYSRNNNTEIFFSKVSNDSIVVPGEETAAIGYVNLVTEAETFLECHDDHIHASVLTTDIGDTVEYVGWKLSDPVGLEIFGKDSSSSNYSLLVRKGNAGEAAGSLSLGVRNDGQTTISDLAGNGDSAVVLSSNAGVLSSATLASISPWTGNGTNVYLRDSLDFVAIGQSTSDSFRLNVLGPVFLNNGTDFLRIGKGEGIDIASQDGVDVVIGNSEFILSSATGVADYLVKASSQSNYFGIYNQQSADDTVFMKKVTDILMKADSVVIRPNDAAYSIIDITGNLGISQRPLDSVFVNTISISDTIAPDAGVGTLTNLPTGISGNPTKYFIVLDENGNRYVLPGFPIP